MDWQAQRPRASTHHSSMESIRTAPASHGQKENAPLAAVEEAPSEAGISTSAGRQVRLLGVVPAGNQQRLLLSVWPRLDHSCRGRAREGETAWAAREARRRIELPPGDSTHTSCARGAGSTETDVARGGESRCLLGAREQPVEEIGHQHRKGGTQGQVRLAEVESQHPPPAGAHLSVSPAAGRLRSRSPSPTRHPSCIRRAAPT